MKQLNINKFELPFNFITDSKDWANEEQILKVTLTPEEFDKGNQRDPKTYIKGTLTMKYKEKELTLKYFRYEIGGDIRSDIFRFMKYNIGFAFYSVYPEQAENFSFFLELIERIKPTYNIMK